MVKRRFRFGMTLICSTLMAALFAPGVNGEENDESMSHMTGSGGAVASEDVHATDAGMTILEQGGNAVDAAVAVAAAQGVTRPYSGGIGGGGMMLIHLAEEDEPIAIDSRSITPASFNDETYINPESGGIFPSVMRTSSGKSFSVPGTVKNWEVALEEYGTMTFAEVLQPAIDVAEEGFIADENFVRETTENQERFDLFASTRDIYLNEDGSAPEPGDVIQNPDMAHTYQLIAEEGSEVFYEGDIAEAMVDTINDPPVVDDPDFAAVSGEWLTEYGVLEGDVTMEDFANYETVTREPIHTGYRGYDIYGMPPSSSGGLTIGQTFNMLEHYDMENMSRTEAWHYFMEATRYAIADRREYIGDPAHTDVPVDELLSDAYTEERITNIDSERASIGQVPPGNPWLDDDEDFFYDFAEEDGAEWDARKFHRIDTGPTSDPFDTSFTIEDEAGKIDLSARGEERGSAYGRAAANMEPVEDNEVNVRVRADEEGYDQRLRLWLNGDVWQSGSSIPSNGYGLEINTETGELVLQRVIDGNLATLERIDYPVETDWHDLRFRVENNELKVNAWGTDDEEPEEWLAVHELADDDQLEEPLGRLMMSVINFDYEQTQTFFLDHIEVEPVIEDSETLAEPSETSVMADDATPPAETTSIEEEAEGVQADEEQRMKDEADIVDESTIHLAVSDDEGNVVSYTTTIVSIGGNGMVVPGYGFLLNNAVYGRTPTETPSHPNYPRPEMRSMSSMAPTLVMEEGEPVLTVGAPGSDTILTTLSQIMMNNLDFGVSLPDAIEQPRLSQRNNFNALAEYEENYLDAETEQQIEELEAMGHRFTADTAEQGISAAVGIEFLEDGQVTAATEPERRGGGSALVESEMDDEEVSAEKIRGLVESFDEEGEFENDDAVRALDVHLTSVGHFENQEEAEKVVHHMGGFKDLLDHQQAQEWISDDVYDTLLAEAEALIEMWE
ncbi:gamma-glutamyltransferase [Natribacillus halophilus]|uniref:Gamma-glutamyltranspeptidase n=1 Tax=Natribacillus halophilus TaxID=549003 RepID=A0A1G8MUK1_9BACI|nr:gamma-glutamyltransferase [Natribacillus halophilus]SDI71612.1 gamma-glutamyltranspeptidase [Natribacillus halophilus]